MGVRWLLIVAASIPLGVNADEHEPTTPTPTAFSLPPMDHIPNTYCQYYSGGGDGTCAEGKSFEAVWQACVRDGADRCMGVMWNSCTGPVSDTSVNGAWKLMTAGQAVGDAENPTETCGGSAQALGHWDVFVRLVPSPQPTASPLPTVSPLPTAAPAAWRSSYENRSDDESFGIGVELSVFLAAVIGFVFAGIMVGNVKQRSLDLQATASPA
jgi:hypothetical protein